MSSVPSPDPVLATHTMVLRPWRSADLPALFTEFSDPVIVRFSWPGPDPYTEADAQRYLTAQEHGRRRGEQLELALVSPIEGKLLGCVALYDIDQPNGRGSIGYWVAAHARGRHLAATAVGLLSAWAFTTLQLARLELTCGPDNAASQRVAAQAGFTREGVMRSHTPFKGGRRDTVLFSLLPDDPVARPLPAS